MKRIVVKVGSTLLATEGTLRMRYAFLYGLISDIADLRSRGYDVVLMSSGAVALGCQILKRDPSRASIETKQAASAVGQPVLINAYKQIAQEFNLDIAQVLISLSELSSEEHYYNISNTIESLFEYPIIPIVNENDTVATEELRVGDNDRIAACVARMINAQNLVILTNIDGLYDRDPGDPEAKFIEQVSAPQQFLAATSGTSSLGSGGMKTKLQAASIAQEFGCITHIGAGVVDSPVSGLLMGTRRHTRVVPDMEPTAAKNLWCDNQLKISV